MALRNTEDRYGWGVQGLHWVTVLGLAGAFVLGFTMVELAMSPTKLKMYSWHKWLGVCLFGLVLLRLLWRSFNRAPPLPQTVPEWQRRVATGMHVLLYLLLLAVPISGWLMSSAKGFPTVLFGLWQLPDAVARDAVLAERLEWLHFILNKSLLTLIAVHIAAALKHHFIDRDGVLARMLPLRRKARKPT